MIIKGKIIIVLIIIIIVMIIITVIIINIMIMIVIRLTMTMIMIMTDNNSYEWVDRTTCDPDLNFCFVHVCLFCFVNLLLYKTFLDIPTPKSS